jgi:hypothetical protein
VKKIFLSSVVMLAWCGSVLAADLPAATYQKAPVPVAIDPGYNWSGF